MSERDCTGATERASVGITPTTLNATLSGHVDWISATVAGLPVELIDWLCEGEWEDAPAQKGGFHESAMRDTFGLRVSFRQAEGGDSWRTFNDAASVLIEIPGGWLEHLRWRDPDGGVAQLLDLLASHGARVTRCDVAVDLRGPDADELGPAYLAAAWNERRTSTRWKSSREVIDRNDDAAIIGHTTYVGKRGSDAFLRCYDKRLESIASGAPVGDYEGSDEPWVRWEIEVRGRLARETLAALRGTYNPHEVVPADERPHAVDLARGWISQRLAVLVDERPESNAQRAERCGLWQWFIEVADAELRRQKEPELGPVGRLRRTVSHARRQRRSIRVLFELGGFPALRQVVADTGEEHLHKWQRAALEAYRDEAADKAGVSELRRRFREIEAQAELARSWALTQAVASNCSCGREPGDCTAALCVECCEAACGCQGGEV